MKNLLILLTVAVVTAVCSSSAKAVMWDFQLGTTGDPNTWSAPSVVETGAPQYDYSWEITEAWLWIEGGSLPKPQQIPILDNIPPEGKSGSGTEFMLPFDILTLHLEPPETPGITADIYLFVDSDGRGQGSISNITLGTIPNDEEFNVTAAEFAGTITVNPIPEPATAFLLGLGSMVLLIRRRA
ncbi:MAG: PEP-CTERM sorting domain-containing protein [Planctomycetota bacterium]